MLWSDAVRVVGEDAFVRPDVDGEELPLWPLWRASPLFLLLFLLSHHSVFLCGRGVVTNYILWEMKQKNIRFRVPMKEFEYKATIN